MNNKFCNNFSCIYIEKLKMSKTQTTRSNLCLGNHMSTCLLKWPVLPIFFTFFASGTNTFIFNINDIKNFPNLWELFPWTCICSATTRWFNIRGACSGSIIITNIEEGIFKKVKWRIAKRVVGRFGYYTNKNFNFRVTSTALRKIEEVHLTKSPAS